MRQSLRQRSQRLDLFDRNVHFLPQWKDHKLHVKRVRRHGANGDVALRDAAVYHLEFQGCAADIHLYALVGRAVIQADDGPGARRCIEIEFCIDGANGGAVNAGEVAAGDGDAVGGASDLRAGRRDVAGGVGVVRGRGLQH